MASCRLTMSLGQTAMCRDISSSFLQFAVRMFKVHALEQQFPSILEQQLAPALQKLDNVSARVQAIQRVVEDRLQSVQTPSVTEEQLRQQLESVLERTKRASAQLQIIHEDFNKGAGRLDDRA